MDNQNNMQEYKIVSADHIGTLEDLINQHMKAGWNLYGHIIIGVRVYQPMTRIIQENK